MLRQDEALTPVVVRAVAAEEVDTSDDRAFVGRRQERRMLADAIAVAASTGRPHVVLVDGEPGIGKTRLVDEVTQSAGAPVVWGRSPEHEVAPPLWPWEQALRGLPGKAPQELLDLLADDARAEWDAAGARLRLFEAVTRWLCNVAPVVVVLDDLHWADTASLRLLTHVATSLDAGAITVVGTVRRHEEHALTETLAALARAGAQRISLGGLSDDDVRELASELTGGDVDAHAATRLRGRTGGNPFFLQQLVQLPDDGALPQQVRDVVLARVARLPEAIGRLLTIASIAGLDVDGDVAAEVADLDEDDAIDLFDGAIAAGLFVEGDRGLSSYRFTHALARDALLSRLSRARRARLHRRYGEVTARRWEGADDRAGEIAHHWLAAAELDPTTAREAMRHAARAADVAMRRFAPEDAALLWQESLAAADLAGADDAERFELLLGLAAAYDAKGDTRDMLVVLDSALDRAEGDVARVTRVADAAMGRSTWYPFEYGMVPARLRSALHDALQAAGSDPSRERALLLAAQGAIAAQCADFAAALDSARAAIGLARALRDDVLLARVLHVSLFATMGAGYLAEHLHIATELVQCPGASPEQVACGKLIRVTALVALGRLPEGRAELDEVFEAARSLRSPSLHVQASIPRLGFLAFAGRYDEAAALAAEVQVAAQRINAFGAEGGLLAHHLDVAFQRGGFTQHSDASLWMRDEAGFAAIAPAIAMTLLEQGKRDEARAAVIASAGPPVDYTWLAWAGSLLIAAIQLDVPQVVRRQRELLEPYRDGFVVLGSVNGILGCTEQWLGEAALCLGDFDTARGELTSAVARLEAAGAAYWTDRARQALAKCTARGGAQAARIT